MSRWLLMWSSHPWTGTLCGRANPENQRTVSKKCPFYRITIPCEEWGFFQKADPWQPSQCCSLVPSASDRAPSNISHMIEIHFQICKSKILPWFKTNKLWEKNLLRGKPSKADSVHLEKLVTKPAWIPHTSCSFYQVINNYVFDIFYDFLFIILYLAWLYLCLFSDKNGDWKARNCNWDIIWL